MKIGDELILFFSRVFLSKFSLEALFLLWVKGYLGLAAWLSREFQPRGNWTVSCPILSCSAPAGVMLQLLACLACEQLLEACSHESPARSSHESLFFLRILEHFFTLSHSLPLQESHLNTGLLIVEIQANLARNKTNKMVDKIQPYNRKLFISVFLGSRIESDFGKCTGQDLRLPKIEVSLFIF